MAPTTRYARSGDLHIAYQAVGDGPIDVLFVPGFVSHVELQWDDPCMARFLNGIASIGRLITFDKRGTGLSDRVGDDVPTLEERVDDVRAVLDAAGSTRAAVIGLSDGGPMCALFAALHPDRVTALIFIGGYARRLRADDYPWGVSEEEFLGFIDEIEQGWGTEPVGLARRIPSRVGDPAFVRWWSLYMRTAASPGAVVTMTRMNAKIDVRSLLDTIQVPTLVVHAVRDLTVDIGHARYLAEHIAGAKLLEIDSDDHVLALAPEHVDEVVGEIQHFLTGERTHAPDLNRVLATVLFTDLVSSTEHAAAAGDRQWRAVLDEHDRVAAQAIARYQGRVIKSTGDGVLATFDGPARAVHAAAVIRDEVASLGVELRAGIHTGEIELRGDDVAGLAVHIASRIEGKANAGEILVSRTVTDLVVGSGIGFEARGEHHLKGVPGEWAVYAVSGGV